MPHNHNGVQVYRVEVVFPAPKTEILAPNGEPIGMVTPFDDGSPFIRGFRFEVATKRRKGDPDKRPLARRERTAARVERVVPTPGLDLLHPKQREVIQHPARFRVLACGRRWGKTRTMSWRAAKGLADAEEMLWVTPERKQFDSAWVAIQALQPACRPVMKDQIPRLVTPHGGRLTFAPAADPENLRSVGLNRVFLDECDRLPKRAWVSVIRPALMDLRGEAMFGSTMRADAGESWLEEIYDKGQSDDEPDWASWRFPSWENPSIPPEEIEAARRDMPEVDFLREVAAQFVRSTGARLKPEWIKVATEKGAREWADILAAGVGQTLGLAVGVDIAFTDTPGSDYTAAVVVGRSRTGNIWVIDADRHKSGSLDDAVKMVVGLGKRWGATRVVVEDVGGQKFAAEAIRRATTWTVTGQRPQGKKPERFSAIEVRFMNGEVRLAPGLPEYVTPELLAFPVGEHDDLCDSIVYGFLGCPSAPEDTSGRPRYADPHLRDEIERRRQLADTSWWER